MGGQILDIKKTVNSLKHKYRTNNPYELCEYLNIKIFYSELGNIKGFYQSAPKNKIIHINYNLDNNSMMWTLAHELGHALLHSKINILFLENHTHMVKNKYEIEADTFAAELLIDDSLLHYYDGYTMDNIAESEGMDPKFLKYKFLCK